MSIRNLQDGPLPLGMLRIEREKKIYEKFLLTKPTIKTVRRRLVYIFQNWEGDNFQFILLSNSNERFKNKKNKEYSESGTVFERRKNRFLQR